MERRLAQNPQNRVLQQLEICARDYGCYNAQNVFFGRWEGAVPVSPACNAVCVGCISEQPKEKPPSPQERFRFVPTVEEIVEVGLAHLQDDESIYSFGQGCEGEPLLQGKRIAEAVAELRRQTNRGTIHLNTNGSRPQAFAAVAQAGLDSLRVSLNSVLEPVYTAYYQPRDYAFKALEETICIARSHGILVSLNYLHMPGWNDREEEVEALCDFVNRLDVQMLQMRTLNIDPDLYAQTVPIPSGSAIGIGELIGRVSRARPELKIGNHTLPKSHWDRQGLAQG
jgi:wyosine [tRNA(Phe)-imidazoG37] synthetase (radical SAM superfamily)